MSKGGEFKLTLPAHKYKSNQNQRYSQKVMATQQELSSSGGLIFGSSQLNAKLGKTKSKADLFGDFRAKIGKDINMQDFIMSQQPVKSASE